MKNNRYNLGLKAPEDGGEWHPREVELAREIIASMSDFRGPRTTTPPREPLRLSSSEASRYRRELRCQIPGILVRHLLGLLGFDENRVFNWRFEHKLVQALILRHYYPDSIPATRGFAREFGPLSKVERKQKLRNLGNEGLLIKPSLGYGSSEAGTVEQSEAALDSLDDSIELIDHLTDEKFIVQRRIAVVREYRVITFEEQVVSGLTFHRFDFGRVSESERENVDAYVLTVLKRLPNAIVLGSLLAWDVAQDQSGKFFVIEVNVTGFHPVFSPGFHCTGLFSDPACASPMTAKLISFVEKHFNTGISICDFHDGASEQDLAYQRSGRWKELMAIADSVNKLAGHSGKPSTSSHVFGDYGFLMLLNRLVKDVTPLIDLCALTDFQLPENDFLRPVDLVRAKNRGLPNAQERAANEKTRSLAKPSSNFVTVGKPTEIIVAEIWSEVLDIDNPGLYSGFLESGGDSLMANRVIARVRKYFGIELPLAAVLTGTIAGMSATINDRRSKQPTNPVDLDFSDIPIVQFKKQAPLSFSEETLWYISRVLPGQSTLIIEGAVRLCGALDIAALRKAVEKIVIRHETLRTTFKISNGSPVRMIASQIVSEIEITDLQKLPKPQTSEALTRLIAENFRLKFDVITGPLWKVKLLKMDEREYILLIAFHHIISDGWSVKIFLGELQRFYELLCAGDSKAIVQQLPVQYSDYAVWSRQRLKGQRLERLVCYWKTRLASVRAAVRLPADNVEPAVPFSSCSSLSFVVSSAETEEIRDLCRRQNVTMFTFILAALNVLIFRYTGEDDITVGVPVSLRSRSELEGLIGLFMNIIVLRTSLSGKPTFQELLARVHELSQADYEHLELPYSLLTGVLERNSVSDPLYQVALSMNVRKESEFRLPGATCEFVSTHIESVGRHDLTLHVLEVEALDFTVV